MSKEITPVTFAETSFLAIPTKSDSFLCQRTVKSYSIYGQQKSQLYLQKLEIKEEMTKSATAFQ